MYNSSSLLLTPPCCAAWSLGGWGGGGGGGGGLVAFLGKEIVRFGCSTFLTIPTIEVIVLWFCLKEYLNLIKHKPHPDCQLAFGFNSNFPTSILVSFSYDFLGVLHWIELYTIRTRYSPRHRFKYWLSIQKEYLVIFEQITVKIDRIFYLQ